MGTTSLQHEDHARGPSCLEVRKYWLILGSLCGIGLLLRLWNIDFGLPLIYHPDEIKKYDMITWLLNGMGVDYRINPLIHPGLMVNLVASVCRVRKALGFSTSQPVEIILTGRMVAAVLGAATIWPVGMLASSIFNRWAGLIAAAAVTFAPLHVIHSRYLKEDIFLTFFVVLSMLGLVLWIQGSESSRRRFKWLMLAAAAGGFGAASKYVGLIMPVLLFLYLVRHEKLRKVEWVILLAVLAAAFSLAAPQLVMGGRNSYIEMSRATSRGTPFGGNATALHIYQWPDWGTHFLFHGLGEGLNWPLTVVSIWGVVLALRARRSMRAASWTALAVLAWYFTTELTTIKRENDAERYILPCVPLCAVLGAGLMTSWRPNRLLRWTFPRMLSGRVWSILPIPLILTSVVHSGLISYAIKNDTRQMAAQWLMAHGPQTPYRFAMMSYSNFNLDFDSITTPKISYTQLPNELARPGDKKKMYRILRKVQALTLSEFYSSRYERFPHHSRDQIKYLKKLRKQFPHDVIHFRKPFYMKGGFHNPDIEIRFKEPVLKTLPPPGSQP